MIKTSKKMQTIIPLCLAIITCILLFSIPLKLFILIFGGILVGILSIYNINIGIAISIIGLPFIPDELSLIFIIFLVGVFLFNQLYRDDYSIRGSFMGIPIIIFVIAIIISTITSTNPTGSFRDLAIHLSALGFLFIIVNSVKNKNELNVLLTTFIFVATLVALYGLYQYKIGINIEAKWVDKASNPDITTRIFSVFGNPNIFAEYLIMSIPISISLFWTSKKILKKLIFLLISLILTIALILTFSRGGWVGFVFGVFIFILLVEKRLLLSLIPIGIISVFIIPNSVLNRIMSIVNLNDTSNSYRIRLWKITLDVIRDNWLVGVGFGHLPFKQTFETYIRTMPTYHAHNTFLEITAEMGIIGLIILLTILFVTYKYSIKNLTKQQDKYLKVITAGLLAGLSSVLCHGLVENILYMPKIIITFWTVIAFIFVTIRLSEKCDNVKS
ncbi:O-antigen ligase family protein [Caloranaerobacter azorensis]|uniref:Polymerase n=1 Tax=Caloranaerobacter azorensis TaxID=116090 RepID=A0A6P1YCX7_9FIRM|nr:O-antigen ligase family protein [Caloranaerobacter azorensis]QIB26984.1 polymerase [Caloranaerobacter azorensis]